MKQVYESPTLTPVQLSSQSVLQQYSGVKDMNDNPVFGEDLPGDYIQLI